ncbi:MULTISPECIES: hypothetical protein [Anoxybacillus]|uniref:hypothetical protein n=1 Tax=Anoxybacillus TaxID=150247 RepID=UPI001F506644|nr:hypothetical protein [Anoxybacillus flavithermus]
MFSIDQEMKKLSEKHLFFSSKEAFKNSFKHQLQEKFRVIEMAGTCFGRNDKRP